MSDPVSRLNAAQALVLALGLAACGGQTVGGESEVGSPLSLEEATIRGIHDAFASGTLACVQLVEYYLRRVEAYDDRGPALNAILTVNPRAVDTARELDRLYATDGADGRPLHCIPVIVKDNFDTADMATTGASVALAQSVPPDDAFVVRRAAGGRSACFGQVEPHRAGPGRDDHQLFGRTDPEPVRPQPHRRADPVAGRVPRSPPTSACWGPEATPGSRSGRQPRLRVWSGYVRAVAS